MGDNLCITIVCSTFNVVFVVWQIKLNIRNNFVMHAFLE